MSQMNQNFFASNLNSRSNSMANSNNSIKELFRSGEIVKSVLEKTNNMNLVLPNLREFNSKSALYLRNLTN
jgi:hypothetical protein